MRIALEVLAVGAGLIAVMALAFGWVMGNGSAESEIEAMEAAQKAERAEMRRRFRAACADADEALANERLKL